MRTPLIVLCLVLAGCGSCLDDKKSPESEQPLTKKSQGVVVNTDAGVRIVETGEGPSLSSVLSKLDAGQKD